MKLSVRFLSFFVLFWQLTPALGATPVPMLRLPQPLSLANPAPPGSTYFLDAIVDLKRKNFGRIRQLMDCAIEVVPSYADLNDQGSYMSGYYAPVEGMPGAYMVMYGWKQLGVNEAFCRLAAIKGEMKGVPANTLIPSRDLTGILPGGVSDVVSWQHYNYMRRLVALAASGQNISGADVRKFRSLVASPLGRTPGFELNAHEEGLLTALANDPEIVARGDKYYLIGLGVEHSVPAETNAHLMILGHEGDHAHYYLDQPYHDDIHFFWHNQLTDEERNGIRTHLAKSYADVLEVIIDEFQAYTLEPTDREELLHYYATIRPRLMAFLKEKGHTTWPPRD